MSALLSLVQMRKVAKPSKYAGLVCFHYSPVGTDAELDCWLDVESASTGSRNAYGFPVEPDLQATATLFYAEIGGEDIEGLLTDTTRAEIEGAFLAQRS